MRRHPSAKYVDLIPLAFGMLWLACGALGVIWALGFIAVHSYDWLAAWLGA